MDKRNLANGTGIYQPTHTQPPRAHLKPQPPTNLPTMYSSSTAVVHELTQQFVAVSYRGFHVFMMPRRNGDRASPSPRGHLSTHHAWSLTAALFLAVFTKGYCGYVGRAGRGRKRPRRVGWRTREPVLRGAVVLMMIRNGYNITAISAYYFMRMMSPVRVLNSCLFVLFLSVQGVMLDVNMVSVGAFILMEKRCGMLKSGHLTHGS